MEQFFTPKNQRENDKCIMNELIKLDLTKTGMIKLNACRMFYTGVTIKRYRNSGWKVNINKILSGKQTKVSEDNI